MICKSHPKYKGIRKPTTTKKCDCMNVWKRERTQAAFSKMVTHVMNQKELSMDLSSQLCTFAGPNNNSCAIGCLLPRKLGAVLDAASCASIYDIEHSIYRNETKKYLEGVFTEVLSECQSVHDLNFSRNRKDRRRMLVKFKDIARSHLLKMPKKAWRNV